MSIEDHDLDYFGTELGTTAQVTLSGAETYYVNGIFVKEYALAEAGGVGVESSNPTFLCADVNIADLSEGDTLTIDSVDYTVRDIQPDGTGQTLLMLDESLS